MFGGTLNTEIYIPESVVYLIMMLVHKELGDTVRVYAFPLAHIGYRCFLQR